MTENGPQHHDRQHDSKNTDTPKPHRSELELTWSKGPGTDTIVRDGEQLNIPKR